MDPFDADLHALLSQDGFVRGIARGLIADPGRIDDVVQDTWWAALKKRPDSSRPLVPWLATVARNFAFKARRDEARRRDREVRAAARESLPSTEALVEREAARKKIVDAVLELPEPLRTAIVLRYFDELPPRAIAKRLGEPVETVKSRLKRGLAILRERLAPDDPESQRTFGLVLVALARPRASLMGTAAASIGALVMTTTTKVAASVVVLAGIGLGLYFGFREKPVADDAPARARAELHLPPGAEFTKADADHARENLRPRAAIDESSPAPQSAPVATTGSLLVRVTFADGSPARDVGVTVGADGSAWADGSVLEARTDAEGVVTLEGLPPGSPLLASDRGDGGAFCDIKAGERTEAKIALKPGTDVEGTVVDESGAPIAGAEVLLDQGSGHPGGRLVARASTTGTFAVRGIQFAMGIWARAPGYAASLSVYLGTQINVAKERHAIRLTLVRGGGTVEGRVVGPDDRPVSNAVVLLGSERNTRSTVPLEEGAFAFTLTSFAVRSDAGGCFRLGSLPLRLLAVTARVRGFAVWRGSVTPGSGSPAQVLIRLDQGVGMSGVVSDAAGQPVGEVLVRTATGDPYDYGRSETRTDAHGSYALAHLPQGAIRVTAEKDGAKASATLTGTSGAALEWSPTLGYGLVIEGRVVNSKGQPQTSQVHCQKEGEQMWAGQMWTPDGRFRFTNLDDAPYRISVDWRGGPPGNEMIGEPGVRPGRADLVITIPEQFEHGGVIIHGSVVDSAGNPVEGAEVCPEHLGARSGSIERTDSSGKFQARGMPGRYEVRVSAKGFPSMTTAQRTLAGGESWDVGKIELQAGGRLHANVKRAAGEPVGQTDLRVRGSDGKEKDWFTAKDDVAESALLVPGRYELLRHRDDSAPIPFEIAAGETTILDVMLEPTVSRTLRIRDEGAQVSGMIHVVAYHPLRLDEYVTRSGSEPFEYTLRLDPGKYDLEIEGDVGHSAKTTLVVPDRNTAAAVIPVVLK